MSEHGHDWRVICDGCRFHTGDRVLVEDRNPRPMGWRPYRGVVQRHRPRRRVVNAATLRTNEEPAHE